MSPVILCVDIGGTHLRAARFSPTGQMLQRESIPTRVDEGFGPVLARLYHLIERVLPEGGEEVIGIGLAVPGPLNPYAGVIIGAPNLPGWVNVPLRDLVAERFGYPVSIGNDANLAALGEHRFGAGRGYTDVIYLTISTGIGSGIITDGRMLLGRDGLGAEAGHIVVEPDGPRCGCGGYGHLEAVASGTALGRQAAALVAEGRAPAIAELAGGDPAGVTGEIVGKAALAGDPVAIGLVTRAARYIGQGITTLLHLFNPGIVILGGGVTQLGDLLFEPIRARVRELAMSPVYWENTPIVQAALGDDVGLLGALALVLKESEPTGG